MKKLSIVITLLLFTSSAFAADEPLLPKFSGYYKNLFTSSRTLSTKEHYYADLNRLRLQADKQFNDTVSARVIYDNEILANDFSGTSDFDLVRQKNQKDLAFWDAEKTITDRRHMYWKNLVYRAYVKYYSPTFQAIAGKQAIDWSRMRFYHPFDLFNPVSPLDLEKDEKIGVDAVNLELTPLDFSSINIIFAPYKNSSRQSAGLKLTQKIGDYDLSLIGARHYKSTVAGAGFDGYIKEAGFRGELTFTRKHDNKEFIRSVIGLDHNFTPKLYAAAEYFYNGGAENDPGEFLNSYEFSRQAMSMKKHILGTGVEYELTGITKLAHYIFYDFEGRSFFFNPELKHNLFTNVDLLLGTQLFTGNDTSEFGNYHALYYAEVKAFF